VGDRAGKGTAYGNFSNPYQSQGDFSKAIAYQTQHLAIAKEVGDRAGEGRAYGSLGTAYRSQGDFSKAIEYHTQDLAIAKEVGDRAGEGTAYGDLGTAYRSQGTTRSTWRLQRRWATGRGRARRTGTSASRMIRRGLQQSHRVPDAAPGDCKGGGGPGGGGQGVREPRQRI
jgi:tetratricopeptide (TPR) repeat protein